MIVWIQCTSQGKPLFATASPSRLESRSLLAYYLYPGEDISRAEIGAEGSTEKQFRVEEVTADKSYRMVGKIGPWARLGAEGLRYLATGLRKQTVYRRILDVEKDGATWYFLNVRLEGEEDYWVRSCWCGTNTYEREVQNNMSERGYLLEHLEGRYLPSPVLKEEVVRAEMTEMARKGKEARILLLADIVLAALDYEGDGRELDNALVAAGYLPEKEEIKNDLA